MATQNRKQYFRDSYGNTASITQLPCGGYRLICKDYTGKTWKRGEYQTSRGAKIALSRTGEGWRTKTD